VPEFRARLIADGVLTEADADAIDEQADKTVTEAVAFADDSPDPSVDELFDGVYASAVANMPRRLPAEPVMAS
jgi:pyruvate dehydrogenase E1 component alpha subunit